MVHAQSVKRLTVEQMSVTQHMTLAGQKGETSQLKSQSGIARIILRYPILDTHMNDIRPWLYIGKYRDTLAPRLLELHRIKAMLQLAEAVPQPGIASLYLPVEDGEPLPGELLRQGVDFVLNARQQGQTILIACGAGQSRSVSFAIAVLKEAENLPLLVAWQEVKRRQPEALPHMALWESLCSYYGEPIPFLQICDPA